jgi:hypothetical protein
VHPDPTDKEADPDPTNKQADPDPIEHTNPEMPNKSTKW